MSIFKRSKPKPTNRLPMTGDVRRGFKFYCAMCVIVIMLCSLAMPVFASETTNDPLTVINNLSDFVFGLIRAVGMITLGFGIVQVGLSLKSHDPSQRANGFLTLAGGVVITFAREILNLITGG
ncbi:MAG: glutamyl-tRNA amidotransferase [Clostridia bacterium]|nr:glutamyl-tRNA amidotransferase [Clostridia bacterium]